MRTCLLLAASTLLVSLTTGCGATVDPGPPRFPAAGIVTIDGVPVSSGSLALRPKQGPTTDCEIEAGKFSAGDLGAVPGPQKVSIYISDWSDGEDGIGIVSITIPEAGDTEISISLGKEDVLTEDQLERREEAKDR